VAPTETIRQELQGLGYPAELIRRVPNGVPLPPPRTPATRSAARAVLAATHPALQLPDGAPLGLYTGRLTREKGLRTLVAAWRPIVDRWPNARLWLAGDGPERKSLDEQIDTLGVVGRVVPVGVFNGVEDLLAAANLFLLPGLDAGTCTALLEAMAAGLPMVASDVAVHRAWITPGRHGLLAAAGDAPAFSAAVTRLLDQPALAAQLGAAARQRAESEASLAGMVEQHMAWFSSLVSAGCGRSGGRPVAKEDL
jgi:glycosyltransferase involved in cell wall biosynthesis